MDPIAGRSPATSAGAIASYDPPEELVSRAAPDEPRASSEQPIPLDREPRVALLCHRPVTFLPAPLAKGVATAGGDHQWLKVGAREVGMGRDDGSVPLDRPDHPGIPSRLVDHRGQAAAPGAGCDVAKEVDPDCVDRALTLGQPTGRWWPGINDCHTVAEEILRSCERPREPTTREVQQAGAGRP